MKIESIKIYGTMRKITELDAETTKEYIKKISDELLDIELQLAKSKTNLEEHGNKPDQNWLKRAHYAKRLKRNQLSALHTHLFSKNPGLVDPLSRSFMVTAKKRLSGQDYSNILQEAIEKSNHLSKFTVIP